jgi:hypothetical protein
VAICDDFIFLIFCDNFYVKSCVKVQCVLNFLGSEIVSINNYSSSSSNIHTITIIFSNNSNNMNSARVFLLLIVLFFSMLTLCEARYLQPSYTSHNLQNRPAAVQTERSDSRINLQNRSVAVEIDHDDSDEDSERESEGALVTEMSTTTLKTSVLVIPFLISQQQCARLYQTDRLQYNTYCVGTTGRG